MTINFEAHYPDQLPLPYLYPTGEGGIQAEWSLNDHEITVDINIDSHEGQWHDLNIVNEEETSSELNLDAIETWQWKVTRIRELTGVSK